jgi:hypothetical protein
MVQVEPITEPKVVPDYTSYQSPTGCETSFEVGWSGQLVKLRQRCYRREDGAELRRAWFYTEPVEAPAERGAQPRNSGVQGEAPVTTLRASCSAVSVR